MPDNKRTASGVLGGITGVVGLSAVAGVLVAATVTPAIALSGAAATSAITMFDNLPSVLEIDDLMLPSNFYATDPETKKPVLLAKFLEQDRTPVTYDQVSPVMYDAILSSEDPRYFQHGGVDLIGTTRAILSNAQGGGETQGGSTISQQYVKNVLIQKCEQNAEAHEEEDENGEIVQISREQALQDCWVAATTAKDDEGYMRKLQEMRYAIALEQKYSKEEILLGYFNIANFGGTTYGVEAAARYYFSTTAAKLTIAQAATLAGMVQNPNNYRIDKPGGSIFGSDGTAFNKAADGVIDEGANIRVLDQLVESGEITDEQRLAAADGYTSTKVRQLYVLSRMLDDGKITREQYVEAAAWPITPAINPPKTGCQAAGGAAYFCQYVKYVILNDPAFGETEEERRELLSRGGLNVYTTLDSRVQSEAQTAMSELVPSSYDMPTGRTVPSKGRLGSTVVSVEATTGRILAIAQNTKFSEDASVASDPNYASLVFAGDTTFGRSGGFPAGSTFKLFTLIDWLEQGHSVNETLNGTTRVFKKMTNSCEGDWYNQGNVLVKNFGGQGGMVSTPMRFTAQSTNTGFFAMAEKLDLCDIKKVATRMGVTQANGNEVAMTNLNSVIGTNPVSPLAMASAYATVANNGVYCQPQAIDRVTDADGNDLPKPQRSCTPVLEPKVAATAAYALQGVMNGGTGSGGNPYDGTPLIGKTGTHEEIQTWLVESSTKVATLAWVGNADGGGDVFKSWPNGNRLSDVRYQLVRRTQAAANAAYGGDRFAQADAELTKFILTELPDVVGMSVDEAKATLQNRGFPVNVGAPVDSDRPAGVIAAQNPGPGRVAGGSTVTISPSNGQGIGLPDVSGMGVERAIAQLRQAGFGNVQAGSCTEAEGADPQGSVTGTDPRAGTVTNRNASIKVNYSAPDCGGGNGRGNDG
ncbi:transglycosylase domain-containing protein [Microbacterium gallinarum]|uniref:Transglycosylase domain-containing protein n=1 Tax=Microbacterium gallinarum TaxID=2762209 RepID=A0ABR8X248_9MICO|nr:transglycosylase domain-containing protein [Microbacterium gallinarum]MBD8023419.1 transglycosylase domain-containing protein [Microbacterium gallinarum]